MNRIVAAVTVLVGAVALQAVVAPPVSAHATLVSATPANGAMLAAPPDLVELVFSESVGTPAALAVLGPDGVEVEGGQLDVVGDTMRRAYDPSSFAAGVYTVSYQVTSADGHPITGTLSFMVHGEGESTATLPATTSGDDTDADPTVVAALVIVLAAALGVALLVTRRIVRQPDVEPVR